MATSIKSGTWNSHLGYIGWKRMAAITLSVSCYHGRVSKQVIPLACAARLNCSVAKDAGTTSTVTSGLSF